VTSCVCLHLDRIVRYLLQATWIAALSYSCELGLNLFHTDLHVYDCFGGVEKAAVTRPIPSSASTLQNLLDSVSIPHKRPQLLSILVGIVAQLLFELPNYRNGVLERILPALEGPRIRGLSRHCNRELTRRVVVVADSHTLTRVEARSHVSPQHRRLLIMVIPTTTLH
jgi:hypothetical protein